MILWYFMWRLYLNALMLCVFFLELVIGCPASSMLFNTSDKFLQNLDDNEALLGSYPVDDNCRLHVFDRTGSLTGAFSDFSKVEKFEISAEAYGKTDFKPGYWVGVKYYEPLGKNDGSVNGKQYFECDPKYGAFVKPLSVSVGYFPEEDYGLEEM